MAATPSTRLTRPEAKARTRALVLDAAGRVFRRHGFHAATIDQVAEEAGFTKGAVYSAFASKADLFFALLAERAESRHEQIRRLSGAAESLDELAESLARWFAESVAGERDWWSAVLEFGTYCSRDPKLRRRFAEHHEVSRELIGQTTAEWADRIGHPLTVPARDIGTAVLAINNGLTYESLLSPKAVGVDLYTQVHGAFMRLAVGAERDDG